MSTFIPTADLCDQLGADVQVIAPGLIDFGGETAFAGPIATLRVHEDNALVRLALEDQGGGRVLVIDGGASLRCALVGGNLAKLAERNQWSGIVVWGAVRDVSELRVCRIGLRALAANPRKSDKSGSGARDVPVVIGGIAVNPGDWLAADADGLVVSPRQLRLAAPGERP
jgi:regulator of ribonuclease activity A